MPRQTLTIDFHGIPLHVGGRYREAELEVGISASFEVDSIRVGIIVAGEYRTEELSERGLEASVLDFIEEEALSLIEAGFEAAAEEAADARREARRDAERE